MASSPIPPQQTTNNGDATQRPAVVIFPGAWHYASAYESFRLVLENDGFEAKCVELPSMGSEPPDKSLCHDSSAGRIILETLVDQGRQVIVIAHSYGGIVAQNAVYGLSLAERSRDKMSGGIVAMVFLAAFAVKKYSTLAALFGGKFPPWLSIDGPYMRVTDPIGAFYHDVESPEQYLHHLTHGCIACFFSPVHDEPWEKISCNYVVCEKDPGLSVPLQMSFAALMPKSTVFSLPSDHSPFINMPDKVLDIIKSIEFNHAQKYVS